MQVRVLFPAPAVISRERENLKSKLTRAAILFVVLLGALYGADYLVLRYRIWRGLDPYSVVKVERYYAVPLKNGKTEILPLEPDNQTCVHSLFPHLGYSPCWYVSRHTEDRINL